MRNLDSLNIKGSYKFVYIKSNLARKWISQYIQKKKLTFYLRFLGKFYATWQVLIASLLQKMKKETVVENVCAINTKSHLEQQNPPKKKIK